jgi:hypothetical protein
MAVDVHSADREDRPSSEVALYNLVLEEDGQELCDAQDSDSETPQSVIEVCNDPLADRHTSTLFPIQHTTIRY